MRHRAGLGISQNPLFRSVSVRDARAKSSEEGLARGDYLLSRFAEHYNERRAHSSLNFLPPTCNDPPPENNEINLDEIVCRKDLGGVIKSYQRRAA